MRASIIGLLLAGYTFSSWAADPTLIDVSKTRAKMTFLTDGQGHYLSVLPVMAAKKLEKELDQQIKQHVFYGDLKTQYWTINRGFSKAGENFIYNLVDERYAWNKQPRFEHKNGQYYVVCKDRKTYLTAIAAEKVKKLFKKTKFKRSPMDFRPYALARNDRGRYFFVDRGRFSDNKKRFRVFSGPKGNLKPLSLVNIVNDSEGDIFSTTRGDLRLIMSKAESWWISKKKKEKLTLVPAADNIPMIFNELGVYLGVRLGTPCDDL